MTNVEDRTERIGRLVDDLREMTGVSVVFEFEADGKVKRASLQGAPSAGVRPLADRVIIKRDEPAKKSGLIHIPDAAQQPEHWGRVVAAGPGRVFDNGAKREMPVKPGDRVLVSKWMGNDVKIGGQEMLVIPESEILAVDDGA
jgi:chaperonin GroES